MFKKFSCGVICAAVLAAGCQMSPVLSVHAAVSNSAAVLEDSAVPENTAAEENAAVPEDAATENAAAPENPENQGDDSFVKDGFIKEDGYRYYYEDGKMVTDSWITAGDNTYYFGRDGRAAVLSCKIKGTYYVFDHEGKLQQPSGTKIVKVKAENGKTKKYYVNKNGKAVSGWSKDQNYYFDETGEMVTGIIVLKEKFYCFNAGGKYNKAKTQKIRRAAGYEKPLADLLKYIGRPKKSEYFTSCYGNGKDGILTYDGYTVYTFKPASGAEIFMGVE